MIKLMCFVKRNPALGVEEFHRSWREDHATLIRDNPAARRYVKRYEQNHRSSRDYDRPNRADYDGVAVQWFESFRDFMAMIQDPEYLESVTPDEARLLDLDNTVWIMTEEEERIL